MKYSKDGEFQEPIVRCDSCAKLVLVASIKKMGMCPLCSNGRFRNVRTLTDEEMIKVKEWNIDPEWIALWEPVEGVQV